jgi:hypothetical protein
MPELETENRKCWTVHFSGPARICVDYIETAADIREFAVFANGYAVEVLLPVTERPEDLAERIEAVLKTQMVFYGIGRSLPGISIIQVYQGFQLHNLLAC